MRQSLFLQLNRMATERWFERVLRRLLRTTWLALCVWCIGIGASLALGQTPDLRLIGVFSLAVLAIGLIWLLFERRMTAQMVARRLDQRFRLHEQLATALEVAGTTPANTGIAALLLDQSTQTLRQVRRIAAQRRRWPWSELITLVALLLVAIGLFFVAGIGQPNLAADPAPLPTLLGSAGDALTDEPLDPLNRAQLTPGQEGGDPAAGGDQASSGDGQQSGQGQGQGQSQDGSAPGEEGTQAGQPQPGSQGQQNVNNQNQVSDPAAQQNVDAIANALRDQGVTRSAADALDRGDLQSAAQQLRELADQASALSDATRRDLANDLRRAASEIQQNNAELAQQLRESASGIERGDAMAAEGLDQLAQAIEGLGGQPPGPNQQGQGQGQGAGEASQPGNGQPSQGQQAPGQGGQGQGDQAGSGGGAGNVGAGEQRPIDTNGRIGADGQPLPIEVQGPGTTSGPPPEQATAGGVTAVGGVTGGNASSSAGGSGPDPLRVPLDERDVVQDYFTPDGPS
jgi:hypothetical protein